LEAGSQFPEAMTFPSRLDGKDIITKLKGRRETLSQINTENDH
jgi:hypothetical protein